MKALTRVGLFLSSLLAAGCTCPASACLEHATLAIRRAEGDQRPWRIRLELGSRTVACAEPDELEPFRSDSCDAGVTLALQPRPGCPAGSEGDAGVCAGRSALEQVIRIDGNPAKFRVTLLDETDSPITTRTFRPDYQKDYVNGRFCDGACKNWSGTWQVPEP